MTTLLGFMRASLMVLALISVCMQAQQSGQPAGFGGSLRGQEIEHPENLSGAWEVALDGTIYGVQIEITTRIDGAPVTLIGAHQTFHDALIGVYERTSSTQKLGNTNWVSDDSPSVHWTQEHLVINQDGTTQGPAINLDLGFDRIQSSWTGRFRLGSFDSKVTLARPCCAEKNAADPLVGTWARNDPSNNCIHITQGRDGSLVSWSDDLHTPRAFLYANGMQPPKETFEQYGSPANTAVLAPGVIKIEVKPLSALCCPVQFLGRLSANEKTIEPATDGTSRSGHWVKMKGDSCVRR
jgi:hypothetical protein